MGLRAVAWRSALVVAALLLNGCGGGGGGSTAGGGNPPERDECASRVCITARLQSTANLALTTTTGAAVRVGWTRRVQDFLTSLFPSAVAASTKTINVLGYDSSGQPVDNPLVANVNLYIAGVVASPDGKDVYLFLDDNQNSTLYADYAAMSDRCILYRIVKSTGAVACLMEAGRHAISNPGRNGREYGNRAEPYLKFDSAGNVYLMAYRGGGSVNHRLYRIPVGGAPEVVRDFVDEYYGQNLVYGRNGRLFYTEVDEFKPSYRSRAFVFDTGTGAFHRVAALDNVYIERIATSIDGNVYVQAGSRLYRVDQENHGLEEIAMSEPGSVLELTRNPAGGVFVLMSDGRILQIDGLALRFIAGVGQVTLEPGRDPDTDLYYQMMVAGDRWIVSRGSSSALSETSPVPAVCVVSLETLARRCETFKSRSPTFYTAAFIGSKVLTFFTSGGVFKQAEVDVGAYVAGEAEFVVQDSTAGNGSIFASVSLNPPVSFVADLSTVTTSTSDRIVMVSYPVADSYTIISLTSASGWAGLKADDLVLRDSAGGSVDAAFRIRGNVISAAVRDKTGSQPSGFLLLRNPNEYVITFPSSYAPAPWTRSDSTRDGYFPVDFPNSHLLLDFSAPVVNLDIGALELKDANGAAVPAAIALTAEGLRLEIRVLDADPANPTGFKALPAGSVFRLTLPDRVRLPGQTFLSPFDKTQVTFTTRS